MDAQTPDGRTTPPTVINDLYALRALFSTPERWTTGDYAKTTHGLPVVPTSLEASCYCLYGGIMRIVGESSFPASKYSRRVQAILDALHFEGYYTTDSAAQFLHNKAADVCIQWNDTHSYVEVVVRIDAALAARARADHTPHTTHHTPHTTH